MITRRRGWIIAVCLLVLLLVGGWFLSRQWGNQSDEDSGTNKPVVNNPEEGSEQASNEEFRHLEQVYTTERIQAIAFQGMGDKEQMTALLALLDKHQIKATFFLPGMRVAEEPDIAREIMARGHEIGNNTLNQVDLSKLGEEESAKEISLASSVIERELEKKPQLVTGYTGKWDKDSLQAAKTAGMAYAIEPDLVIQQWHMATREKTVELVKKNMKRGGVLSFNTEGNTALLAALPDILGLYAEINYRLVPVGSVAKLAKESKERKPPEEIEGYYAAKEEAGRSLPYSVLYSKPQKKNQVVLTFDDWGSDYAVTRILDILRENKVSASFFLLGEGVKRNPNLARAIFEEGHDVGNHTYNHKEVTLLKRKEIQNEIVSTHQQLAHAIQDKPSLMFRPPRGSINDPSAEAVADTGYQTIAVFDLATLDWNPKESAASVVERTLQEVQSGSIILLHLLDNRSTAEALPVIIEQLKKKGYSFHKLSEWTQTEGNKEGQAG